jgi:hypothetical protein
MAPSKGRAPRTADFFAELYVAGRFAEAGWNVYFPRRDRGFDFIASKGTEQGLQLIRPVQVKGKYPTKEKRDRGAYGFIGELSERHPEMVLAIPFFEPGAYAIPTCIAYVPLTQLRPHSRGCKCEPASLCRGVAKPRRDFERYFGDEGLGLLIDPRWATEHDLRPNSGLQPSGSLPH